MDLCKPQLAEVPTVAVLLDRMLNSFWRLVPSCLYVNAAITFFHLVEMGYPLAPSNVNPPDVPQNTVCGELDHHFSRRLWSAVPMTAH